MRVCGGQGKRNRTSLLQPSPPTLKMMSSPSSSLPQTPRGDQPLVSHQTNQAEWVTCSGGLSPAHCSFLVPHQPSPSLPAHQLPRRKQPPSLPRGDRRGNSDPANPGEVQPQNTGQGHSIAPLLLESWPRAPAGTGLTSVASSASPWTSRLPRRTGSR